MHSSLADNYKAVFKNNHLVFRILVYSEECEHPLDILDKDDLERMKKSVLDMAKRYSDSLFFFFAEELEEGLAFYFTVGNNLVYVDKNIVQENAFMVGDIDKISGYELISEGDDIRLVTDFSSIKKDAILKVVKVYVKPYSESESWVLYKAKLKNKDYIKDSELSEDLDFVIPWYIAEKITYIDF